MYYNRFRYYSPEDGGYINRDPIGLLGGGNLYDYPRNPISWVDPFGLQKDCSETPLYRVIRPDENPADGLVAKNPNAEYTVEGHVLHGSKPNFRSQYISTTTDPSVAKKWADKSGNRIVRISPSQVDSLIIDLSTDAGRDVHLRGIMAKNWAKSSSEVLIKGSVPANAVKLLKKGEL